MYASYTGISGVSTNERFAWNNEDARPQGTGANQFRIGLEYIRNSLNARNPTGSISREILLCFSFLILERKYSNYGLKRPRYFSVSRRFITNSLRLRPLASRNYTGHHALDTILSGLTRNFDAMQQNCTQHSEQIYAKRIQCSRNGRSYH